MKNSLSKYRMWGLALAAIAANVGVNVVRNPAFTWQQAALLSGLCVATVYVVHQAVSAVEAIVVRRRGSKV